MSRITPSPIVRRWDSRRRVDPRLLSMQFVVCVASWTVLVFSLNGAVSRDGFISSVITGGILVVASWVMTKMGWNVSGERFGEPADALVGGTPVEPVAGD